MRQEKKKCTDRAEGGVDWGGGAGKGEKDVKSKKKNLAETIYERLLKGAPSQRRKVKMCWQTGRQRTSPSPRREEAQARGLSSKIQEKGEKEMGRKKGNTTGRSYILRQ